MKVKTITLILMAVLLSALLSGCSASAMQNNSWSGLTASEDTAYLANGSFVYAINLSNGSQAWRYPVEKADTKESFFSAPVLTADGQLIVGSAGSNHSLLSLDPQNGSVNWIYDVAESGWVASPLVTEDTIYAPNGDGTIYAIGLNGSLLWKTPINGQLWAPPVSDGEFVYVTALDHHLYAVDLQTHEVAWQIELSGAAPGAPALGDDGMLYVGSFGSEIEAIDPATQRVLWKVATTGWIWDAPALDGETLYFGDLNGSFYALNIADGSQKWDPIKPDGPIVGSPLVMPEYMIIGTESGTAYAIDREGEIVWNYNIGGQLYSAPAQASDLILFSPMETETDFVLAALNFDGNQVWTFTPAK